MNEYSKLWMLRAVLVCGCIVTLVGVANAQIDIVTTSFQNGVDGYNGTFGRAISDVQTQEATLSDVAQWWLDGYDKDVSPPAGDRQILLRFDDIIGSGANRIPANALILDAQLVVTTSGVGNSHSSGPFGVSGLLQDFDATTSYFMDFTSSTDYGSRGPWWQDGSATRPTGNYGFTTPGNNEAANVTSIVQSWANGATNYGFVIQAGLSDSVSTEANTADGWSIYTLGHPYSEVRPQLQVTYTTSTPEVKVTSFQDGTNGYAGTTMALVNSGTNALIADTEAGEETLNGADLDQTFLDGVIFDSVDGTASSPDIFALLKFDNIFGNGADQAPLDTQVTKAWVVMTTGESSNSCFSYAPWSANTMLRDWDTTSLHSSFGDVNGLQILDGDIGPNLDVEAGAIRGSEVWFDVTDYLEGVRNGNTDYGIAIRNVGTGDGWQIYATGSATTELRPRLIVYSGNVGIPGLPGDFDGDNDVDGADFLVWQQELGSTLTAEDLAKWQANFGTIGTNGPTASAIPEPSAFLLLAALAIAGTCVRMRPSFK